MAEAGKEAVKEIVGIVVYRNKGSVEQPKIEYLILTHTKGGEKKNPMPPKGTYFHIDFTIYFFICFD